MVNRRKDENTTKTYFRTERMVKENGLWYFTTREGTIQGPFADRQEAQKELVEYIKIMRAHSKGKLTLAPRAPLFAR